jgi:hypothetical protein
MDQRYVCHVKVATRQLFGQKPELLWGYTIEFVWFDAAKEYYKGVRLYKRNGKLDNATVSHEYALYTALLDLLKWLITNTNRQDEVSIYVENRKVRNQLGNNSKLMSTYDYNALAKEAKELWKTFEKPKIGLVTHESLGIAHQVALEG